MNDLSGKTALVTGASKGIGRAIALAYAAKGANLALVARSEDVLKELAAQIERMGREALPIAADLGDEAEIRRVASAAIGRFTQVDILVNNAGIAGPLGHLEDNEIAAWVGAIQVNLIGVYLCCRATLPVMRRNNSGRIVNLSGAGAANAWANMSAYCSSKAAVVRLTAVLALELAETGITVNFVT